MLYTAADPTVGAQLMASMWAREQSITAAATAAYFKAQAEGRSIPDSTVNQTIANESDFVEATGSLTRGLYEFGLVMGKLIPGTSSHTSLLFIHVFEFRPFLYFSGTSAFTSATALLEPAFVATSSGAQDGADSRPPLYFLQPNCSTLSYQDRSTLSRIGEAISNMTGFPVECVSLLAVPVANVTFMADQVYCGWLSSGCVVRYGSELRITLAEASAASHPIQEYIGALYDWHDTDPTTQRLNVSVWVNDTDVARDPGVPDWQRWAQPINLAVNAFLRQAVGMNASAQLAGIRDMPKGATRLSLDFSSLLGPLFMMWFFQLMLPINVYMLVHEKERHLRIMQRMQGLGEGVYYVVNYLWMLGMYLLFTAVFVGFGSAIGLKIFTLNSYSVQFVFYFLWGNVLAGFSFYFAAWQREARPAVLLAVVYVIITGFVANLVLVQYVEQGPVLVVDFMELIPAFALFRGLYELAQYAFLADRTGGEGLTWGKLLNPDCGMIQVWFYLLVGVYLYPITAFYIEQVTGAGTGAKKHPLFFLGIRHAEVANATTAKTVASVNPTNRTWWRPFRARWHRVATSSPSPPPKHNTSAAQPTTQPLSLKNSSSPTPLDALSPVQSPLDYYYGTSAVGGAGSPQLQLIPAGAETPVDKAPQWSDQTQRTAPVSDPSHLLATKVTRKVSSVRVAVSHGNGVGALADEVQEGPDVAAERTRAEGLWNQWCAVPNSSAPAAILLHQLRKVYPRRDGNAAKVAVHDLSLAIGRCECFGLLGPNGAGKTTTIRMMEGFLDPSAGAAVIEGLSVPGDIEDIYSLMGACPQHDLLWDALTGREHLLFYGRLKNLNGAPLRRAVDDGLRAVNLFDVGEDLVSSYSGGMKRRLSVAIALMGDPRVVYLDEPSTGLDPSSRRLLWEVIKKARRKTALVLTTHSMEEAEALCDRLGIFLNGRLQCIGNPKELTARFGGYLSFTITTPPHEEPTAAGVVKSMAPNAKLVYSLGGTQKYELPLTEIGVDGVFKRMEEVKFRKEVEVLDWGVSNATLEEVFIKITREAGVRMEAWTG